MSDRFGPKGTLWQFDGIEPLPPPPNAGDLREELIDLLNQAARISDRLSVRPEDRYARCTQGIIEALATIDGRLL